jgi:hypothetical protein
MQHNYLFFNITKRLSRNTDQRSDRGVLSEFQSKTVADGSLGARRAAVAPITTRVDESARNGIRGASAHDQGATAAINIGASDGAAKAERRAMGLPWALFCLRDPARFSLVGARLATDS